LIEDTKGVIRSSKFEKDRQYNGPKENGANNDLLNTTQKHQIEQHNSYLTPKVNSCVLCYYCKYSGGKSWKRKWGRNFGYDKRKKEKFGGTKGVTRSRKSKDRQCNGQKEKGQTMIYKTLKILRSGNTNPTKKPWMNSSAPEGKGVHVSLVAPVVLLLVKYYYKSWRGRKCGYHKWNLSLAICDTDIP
jgi:hypothetical protein